ncbi:MAG: TIGR02679 domain-containing protein [Sarcina sp.]
MKDIKVFLDQNKICEGILKECIKKYKSLGKVSGSFKLKANAEIEKNFLKAFDMNVLDSGTAKIKVKDVEKLFKNRFVEYEFLEVLEYVEGKKLITNLEKKALKQEDFENFLKDMSNNSDDGIGLTWFCNCIDKKDKLYKYIHLAYLKRDRDEFSQVLLIIINMLNNLPVQSEEYVRLPIFAARYSKDAHFLDLRNFSGNLFLKIIIELYCESDQSIRSASYINEVYLKVGLLKDNISNNTATYGLVAYKENKKLEAWENFVQIKNPLVVTLKNLEDVDFIIPLSEEVYIFENPAVFSDILDYGIFDKALICTSGQLNLSSHIILEKLSRYKKIYYSGDFDVKGIEIAYNLKLKLKDKLEFLFYDDEHYKKAKSNILIDENRLKYLEKYRVLELDEVINSILKDKKAGYQEMLIVDYLDKLKNN